MKRAKSNIVLPPDVEEVYHDPDYEIHPTTYSRHKPKLKKEKLRERSRSSEMPEDQDE